MSYNIDEKIGVIAGSRQEFKEYVSKQINKKDNGTVYFYVHDANQLYGYRGQLVKIGTYYMRYDIAEIEQSFNLCSKDYDPKD